jgi:phage-related protein
MSLVDYSFSFGTFVFGSGTPFPVLEIDGLEGVPELRVQDDNRGYNDGSFSGRDFYNGRTLTFNINVFAGNGNSASTNLSRLQAALLPQSTGTTTLNFKLSPSDTPKTIQARVRQVKSKVDPEWTFGYIKVQVVMFCPDPRYYETTPIFGTITAPLSFPGRTYDRVYNLSFGGGGTNQITVNNTGWIYTSPIITITGPCVTPTVGLAGTSDYISINYSMSATDQIIIDLNQKLVTLNGATIRNLLVAGSNWFTCPPGNSSIFFNISSGATAATNATISYSPAYI